MVIIYADLVEAGMRSLDGANDIIQVPVKYREGVIKELEKRAILKKEQSSEKTK